MWQNSFQNEIVGRRRVYYGNSWILLLGLLFRQLKKEHSGKSIIILPGYCCNEFVRLFYWQTVTRFLWKLMHMVLLMLML